MKNKISITLNEGLLKTVDAYVDKLIIRNRSQAIEYLLKKILDKEKTAVILAGGPEEKLKIENGYVSEVKIRGIPLVERMVKKLKEEGFRKIYFISRKKILDRVFSILNTGERYGVKIEYLEEEKSNGTGESLKILRNKIKDDFLVLFGDLIIDKVNIENIWEAHLKDRNIATLNLITHHNPSERGAVFMEGNKIIKFIQKSVKKGSYIVFSPIFVCGPELLQYKGASLEEDIFPLLASKRLLNGYLSQNPEIHIHNKRDLEEANKMLKH